MSEKFDEQLKHTIEQIGPDEKQTDEIWRGVQERAQHRQRNSRHFAWRQPACASWRFVW